jgi:DNA-binding NarL/FixJ family response regulator
LRQYGICRTVALVRVLPERDVAALLAVVGELAGLDAPVAFPPEFVARLGQLVGCDAAAYSVLDRRNEVTVFASWWEDGDTGTAANDAGDNRYWRLRHSHPLCAWRENRWSWTDAHTVSEFASTREFRRTAIWDELYRHEGVNYWLDIGLPPEHGNTRVFLFTRRQRDFGERERLILDLLEPHLERRAEEVRLATEAAAALADIEQDVAPDARDVVLVAANGAIEFASAHSRELLERHFGHGNGRLPAELAAAITAEHTIVRQIEESRLTVRATRTGGLFVLLLSEESARVDRLTPRQREILTQVGAGLTDIQIADRLEISPATVRKHLEQIYERLDVHTRTDVEISGPSVTPVLGGSGAPTGMFLITGSGFRSTLFWLDIVPMLIGPSITQLLPRIETVVAGCVHSDPWKIWVLSFIVKDVPLALSAASVSIELLPLVPCQAVNEVLHGLVAHRVVLLPDIVIDPEASITAVPV